MNGVVYRIEVIGGPFDGAPGMSVRPLGTDQRPPDRIMVGVCSGHGDCATGGCGAGRPKRHVAYWIPEYEDAPVAAEPYELEDFDDARARYVIGGTDVVLHAETVEEAICYG